MVVSDSRTGVDLLLPCVADGSAVHGAGTRRRPVRHYADDLAESHSVALPFVRAQLLHASGNLHRAIGDRRTGIDELIEARSILTDLGATPLLSRCQADLSASGLTDSGLSNPLTLTEREEDVAALVIRGATNKEVAAELFLTSKTVEFHLSKIYAKLGVRSRWELRRMRGSPTSS